MLKKKKHKDKVKIKKKRSPFAAYSEPLRRWVTMDELLSHMKAIHKGEDPYPSIEDKEQFPELAKLVKQFLVLNDGISGTIPCSSKEGHYEGLVDFLKGKGKHKSAKEIASQSALKYINAAWRLYRQDHPQRRFKPINPAPVVYQDQYLDGNFDNPPKKRQRQKQMIVGHELCSFIRRLANEGYDSKEIDRVITHYGKHCSRKKIMAQIWCASQKGKYGLSANLTPAMLDEILDIVCKTAPKHSKKQKK